jgi:23S rRNA (uracil1939-C5)-methyltransferase
MSETQNTSYEKRMCSHFGVCGGCTYLNVDYSEQLKKKEDEIRALIEPFYKGEIKPIIPSPEIYFYRNKMEYAFGRDVKKEFALGLRQRGAFNKFVDIKDCLLLSEISNALLEETRQWAIAKGFTLFNPVTHTGTLRYFVIREGKMTGDILVNFITWPDMPEAAVKTFAENLHKKFPRITTFIWGKNSGKSDVARTESTEILWGDGYIHDKIGKNTFKISPSSFFQTNTRATEKLYGVIKDYVLSCGSKERTVLDLYCGNGGISLFIADDCKDIVGIEMNPEAVRDGEQNLISNNVTNVKFIRGEMENVFPHLPDDQKSAIAIIDPPRSGLHPKTVKNLMLYKFPELIYVSCNPQKLAADMKTFSEIYDIHAVQPLDLFPHTPHMETVALFKLKV